MEATSDDSPKSHEQNGDIKKGASAGALPLSKEFDSSQTEDTTDHSVREETQFRESGTKNTPGECNALKKSQQGAVFSGKILSFCCLECKGDTTYSPNDLLKHFQVAHKGKLPTYPCDLCTFVTNEFPSLQRHRIGHRDTLVTCEICNDGVQYSLRSLTRHFNMCHSRYGLFCCKKCEFSTRDAGTFVQHNHYHNVGIQKCVKCPSINSQGKIHYGKAYPRTFPFTCQLCGYGAVRMEYLSKHMALAHKDEMEMANKWRSIEGNSVHSPGLKLLLKKTLPAGASRDPQLMSKLNSYPGVNLFDHSGRLFNPEKTLEETQQFLERAVGVKKETKKWVKGPLKGEQQCSYPVTSTTPQPQENELCADSGILDAGNSNGFTVLMVKNKISIPPNCTTKVMGFKMVDGKKHLVLKVIPTKQETTTNTDLSPTNNAEDDEKTSSLLYSSHSGTMNDVSSSDRQIDTDTKTGYQSLFLNDRKANMEPTSTQVIKVSGANSEASSCTDLTSINKEEAFSEKQCSGADPEKKSLHHDKEHCFSPSTKTMLAKHATELESGTALSSEDSSTCEDKLPETVVSADFTSSLSDKVTTPLDENDKIMESTEDHSEPKILLPTLVAEEREIGFGEDALTPSPNLLNIEDSLNLPSSITESSPSKDLLADASIDSNTSPQNKLLQHAESPDAKGGVLERVLQNSPNQEVFSFHNYSKETFGGSPDFMDADEHSHEDLEEDQCGEDFDELKLSSDWSLTLPASPLMVDEQSEGRKESITGVASVSRNNQLERVSGSDIELEECLATVEDLPIPVMSKTDKVACFSESEKKEHDFISTVFDGGSATSNNAAVLGKILEEHSDAIISQQLEKERMVSSEVLQDANRPTKTTLKILQTPEGKKQMFLQTMETPYALPVQLKSGQGFKLITKSCASKVNVSYVNSGIDMPSKGSGLSLTLNGGRIGMAAQSLSRESKGQASLLQTRSSNGGRYFVSASALKGSYLLSGSVKSPLVQTCKTQPTCYLVQRPLPVPPSTESTSSTSKTVLAMPVKSADKVSALQTGRQAYLVRYISPAKSGLLINSSNDKETNQSSQANKEGKSRVFLKIVKSPNGTRFLSTSPYTSAKKLYVATSSLQSPYLLMSSDCSGELVTSNSTQNPTHKLISTKLKNIRPQSANRSPKQVDNGLLVHTRPRSQRKRRKRRMLFEESFEKSPKIRRMSSRDLALKEKDVKRTLRLSPFSPSQQIKYPRHNQPVVVLNHPDADIPEVTNILKSVNRYKGEVIKVALSENTVRALSGWTFTGPGGALSNTPDNSVGSRVQPPGNNVRERFILRLKLKKTKRNKYEVVKLSSSTGSEQKPLFSCWFCGRMFNNQEEWIGHGQRHLMEATRDWNKLF